MVQAQGSVGFALQSTGGGGVVVLHDGSCGFLLQSTGRGVGCPVGLHDGSLGLVAQSTSKHVILAVPQMSAVDKSETLIEIVEAKMDKYGSSSRRKIAYTTETDRLMARNQNLIIENEDDEDQDMK